MRRGRTRLRAGWLLGVLAVAAMAARPAAAPAGQGARLRALFDEAWEFRLREDPLLATSVGDRRYDDRLPAMGAADLRRRAAFAADARRRLAAIDPAALDTGERLSAAMFARELEDQLVDHEFGAARIPFAGDEGFHTAFARLPAEMRFAQAADYEPYLARLRAFPVYVGQHLELMRDGLRAGFTLPRAVLDGVLAGVRAHVVERPEDSALYAPFTRFPEGLARAEQERLRQTGQAAIRSAVLPGYRALADFLEREYLPGARTSLGASELPRGREYYARLVKRHTTLELTPAEVHRIGLAEVERLSAELEAAVRRTGFTGSFAEFLAYLRREPRFYARSSDELLKHAAWIAKRMDGQLPLLFDAAMLPRLPYGVEPVPAELAPRYTGGRYSPAPADGSRAGAYWVNTYALESRPLYTLEALTLHEAVPGHHLQVALQQERHDLPAFRRAAGVTAFVEGWALYAERLGLEVGFYQDAYSDFGRLTYEMWRACRLVVDTGLHALGWSRRQARDYLAERTALSLHEVETETDRYIAWPGQALAYKIGELKISELRQEAERELGPAFDKRAFHTAVLAQGPLPLELLERQVRQWIAGAKTRPPEEREHAAQRREPDRR